MITSNEKFIQQHSPDGGFLQSEVWRKFQAAFGHTTLHIYREGFWANIIEHRLPLVGKYFYVPRGPVIGAESEKSQVASNLSELSSVAGKEGAGWIRIEPADDSRLQLIKEIVGQEIVKAPHDMQPKELWIVDISAEPEELLKLMKSKTRYNIRLAEKKGVEIFVSRGIADVERFLDLIEITAKRDRITSHPREYYERMIASIPVENMELFLARYNGKIIAGAMVSFYGATATYLHGASDDAERNVMAPYLLQWRAMLKARERGCQRYDFGGVSADPASQWAGITRFKSGFGSGIQALTFPGSYDIILSPIKYWAYRILQKIR